MDVLSEVLRVIRLSGAIHFCAEFSRPWAIVSSPPEMLTERIPGAESVIPFHIVTGGHCLLSCGTFAPISLKTGDVVVFARGDQHVMASDAGLVPVPIKDIYRPSAEQITVLRYGGGGDESRLICGYLRSDQRFNPLLNAMPALLCIRVNDGALILEVADNTHAATPVTLHGEAAWWQAAIAHLIREATLPGVGNHVVLARLSELLFMEIVRWQLGHASGERGGWLAGLSDPQIGRALALLHAEPAHAWTVDELAQRAGISRAALAKRFAELVGETPIQYLARWRMHLARSLLRESTLSLAEIAPRVGYESEAAFSRAFRRETAMPPAAWRQAKAEMQADRERTDGKDTNANAKHRDPAAQRRTPDRARNASARRFRVIAP